MDAIDISDKCVDICFTDREGLLKMCMNNALDKMHTGSSEEIPDDSSIFCHSPSKDMFVEYASLLMKREDSAKEISRVLIASLLEDSGKKNTKRRQIHFDSDDEEDGVTEQHEAPIVQSKRRCLTPRNPRNTRNTRSARVNENQVETDDDSDDAGSGSGSGSGSYPSLPPPLSPASSGSMTTVSREYFPDSEFVFPGIYTLPGDTGYVLFCVDNGRYSNAWSHKDNVTTLTWVTASKDVSRRALVAISESRNVHVFRKIAGESNFRYMGKVFRSGNVDRRKGTVELAVC